MSAAIRRRALVCLRSPGDRGFSLVEIMVAGGLFMIMCIAILGVYRVGLNTEAVTAQRTMLQDGLQAGMKAFDRDIGDATASLDTSSSTSVVVQVPVFDGDGAATAFMDTVTFAASGTAIYQSVVPGVGSSRTAFVNKRLLTNIPSPYPSPGLFTYWIRSNGTKVAASPAAATIVSVTLVQQATYGSRAQKVQLTQDIRLRNR